MSTQLRNFINQYSNFSDTELSDVIDKFQYKLVKKHQYLLKPGHICKDLIFVEKGCLRLFYVSNDIEISVWFAFMQSSAIEMYSFISEKPSDYFIQAVEDSEIFYLPKPELNKLYECQPKMQQMMRNFWEEVILNLIVRFTALQKDPAEKRYRDLLKTREFLERIPQKYLASYIGVTPTSLSRIRKQISKLH